jgi:hypothetical protein
MTLRPEIGKQTVELSIDVFGIAEHVATLGDTDGARLAGPVVDVLEEMAVEGAVVGLVELAGGQTCFRPPAKTDSLKLLKLLGVPDSGPVLQDRRSRVAVRVFDDPYDIPEATRCRTPR